MPPNSSPCPCFSSPPVTAHLAAMSHTVPAAANVQESLETPAIPQEQPEAGPGVLLSRPLPALSALSPR